MGSARLPERYIDFDDEATEKVGCFAGVAGVARRLGSGVLEPVEHSGERSARRRGSIEFRTCRVCRTRGHLTRDCPRKVKSADQTTKDSLTVHRKLKTAASDSSSSAKTGPGSEGVGVEEALSRVDEEQIELNMVLEKHKGSIFSPQTPLLSPPTSSPHPSSPFRDSSLSGSSNRESPFSSSSRSRFQDMMSPFSVPSDAEESYHKAGEYSPTVEFPLEVKPSSLGERPPGDGKPVRPIERWRSISLTEFERMDLSIEDVHITPKPEATPSPEILALERREWSDFDKYGIDIDLFVGSSRLPPADLLSHSGILQPVSDHAFSARQGSSRGVSRSSSSGSASGFSRQTTTTTREEIEPAESDKWVEASKGLYGKEWAVDAQSFGREDSFGPSSGRLSRGGSEQGSWRQTDDEELSVEAAGAEPGRLDWTDHEARNMASPASSASSGWRQSFSQKSKGTTSTYFRTRPYIVGNSSSRSADDPSPPEQSVRALSPPAPRSMEASPQFPQQLEGTADDKGETKRKGKRAAVMNSLKKWLSGPIEVPADMVPPGDQR